MGMMIHRHMGGRPEIDKGTKLSKGLIRRVYVFARPYRRTILITMGAISISSILSVGLPPTILKSIIDDAILPGNVGRLNFLAIAFLIVIAAASVFQLVSRWLSARVGESIIFDLRVALFDHVQHMPIAFFTRTQTGALMTRLNSDVLGAQRAITETSAGVVQIFVDVTVALIAMFILDYRLTLLGVVMIPIFLAPTRFMGRRLQKLVRRQMENNAALNSQMTERFQVGGALLAKLFGRPTEEVGQFGDRAGAVRDVGVKVALYGRLFFIMFTLVASLGTVLVYWVGGRLVISDSALTFGTLVAFIPLLMRLYQPVTSLSNLRVELMTSFVSFERVFEVLDFPSAIVDKPGAVDLEPKGKVEFDNVRFRYPPPAEISIESLEKEKTPADRAKERERSEPGNGSNGGRQVRRVVLKKSDGEVGPVPPAVLEVEERSAPGPWVLHGLSFIIEPGQMVALVGPSGGGKTTISNLIPRLYDATEGAVKLDGTDVKDLTQDSLRAAVGVVTQDSHMFHETIRSNLMYAAPDSSEQDLIEATKAAQIYDLIAGLPQGYDTTVGERGYRLSGGEKQRLAIARLLLKDPAVMILDEATAHLDSESEALIQQALGEALSGRSTLAIAHRLSTVQRAEEILVIDKGRIVERGNHFDLVGAGGLYSELHATQFQSHSS